MSRGKFEKKKQITSENTKKTGKKGSLGLKIIIAVLAIVLVLLVGAALILNYITSRLGSFDDPAVTEDTTPVTDEFDTDSTISGQETIETMDASDVTFQEIETIEGDGLVHIMLIGQDARPGEGRSRSDTMILVTINKAKNAIQLTSFMRDTYVQIPGYMNNRLNAAYRYGGTDLMNATFLKNFGVEIDGNVMVNFSEFVSIIDLLGGIDMELSSEETNYMHNHGYPEMTVGMNHMDGETTLEFVRMRYVSGGDYGRTERQRRVLAALVNSVRGSNISTILGLIDEVLPHIVTNLTDAQIVEYAYTGMALLADGAELQTLRIPADDAHYGAMISEMSVLVPNLEMCREDLEEFFFASDDAE